ncbi:MAG: hypothetical protein A2086_01615 [Spirochaetes bacterium GWD1_27_9]|nr:MAG: hypothetical protein A2Y34_02595 [Spirochaetes bacterium GWC1_27_15]OHD41773.1 MAG: hypothetical protein A2086_01615 [Spirochaetes bacterium GWD1_27_9]
MELKFKFLLFSFFIAMIFLGCQEADKNTIYDRINVYNDPTSDKDDFTGVTINKTVASFWSLPEITFVKWRPNYHIKGSTNVGALKDRVWTNDTTTDNPSSWNIFEYGQIEFFESKYGTKSKLTDVTVDDSVLFYSGSKLYKKTPLAIYKFSASSFESYILPSLKRVGVPVEYETKITTAYKKYEEQYGNNKVFSYALDTSTVNTTEKLIEIKTILEDISFLDKERKDVSYDNSTDSVIIKLNTLSSNFFKLKKGAKLAAIATQRPKQWGAKLDYTVVSSIPKTNVSLDDPNGDTIDATGADRANTRSIGYVEYTGDTQVVTGHTNGWFESMTITEDTITLKMPKLKDGNLAKSYWDTKDPSGEVLEPFCLIWILIQQ